MKIRPMFMSASYECLLSNVVCNVQGIFQINFLESYVGIVCNFALGSLGCSIFLENNQGGKMVNTPTK